ncbi:MAG: hypothetical protein OEL78_06225 [Hyphomicrobiales bacterium]|jgi:hypothetical protein|nr:hypothetical protein [Hyphomicrobiales bacterium]
MLTPGLWLKASPDSSGEAGRLEVLEEAVKIFTLIHCMSLNYTATLSAEPLPNSRITRPAALLASDTIAKASLRLSCDHKVIARLAPNQNLDPMQIVTA